MHRFPLVQLTLAKIRGMVREPEAVFWIFVFPVLLALALGLAFRAKGPEVIPVAVEQSPGAEWARDVLDANPGLSAEVLEAEAATQSLRTGRVALVVSADDDWTYTYDPTRPESREARLLVNDALQNGAGRKEVREVAVREMTEKGSRYIDFLVPGLLGMNLMGTGMWGIGFSIVNMRQKRLLKRLVSTPMYKSHFLVAQILSRMVFLVLEVGALLLVARFVFHVPIRGSLITLAGVSILGGLTFAGIGLLVASRAKTIEGISGLMNVVMMPMWIMSGIFFSTARFPDFLQPIVQALPLTAVIDALRAVMLEGAPWLSVGGDLLIAGAWCVATFLGALALFRWQ